ncbi:MAG: hypothetical protein ACK559_24705, partial [bacterium]
MAAGVSIGSEDTFRDRDDEKTPPFLLPCGTVQNAMLGLLQIQQSSTLVKKTAGKSEDARVDSEESENNAAAVHQWLLANIITSVQLRTNGEFVK